MVFGHEFYIVPALPFNLNLPAFTAELLNNDNARAPCKWPNV